MHKSPQITVIPKPEISEGYGNTHDVEFSIHPNPIPAFYHLQRLQVWGCKDVEVVFEIESSSSSSSSSRELSTTTLHNHQPLILLPHHKHLDLRDMKRMSDVWKCNWKKLVIPQNQSQSSFHNLTYISLLRCNSIKYLFSPLMGTLLPNLKEVRISYCAGIEEVVSNGSYDENDETCATSISTHTNTISFPHLEDLYLDSLPCLKSIDGGDTTSSSTTITTTSIHDQFKWCAEVGIASWFLSQYSKKIFISDCRALSRVFPSYVVGRVHKLKELRIFGCKSMMEIFENEGVNIDGVHSSDDSCTTITIPRSAKMTLLELPNLTILYIGICEVLEYIFTSSTLESLKQLKELTVEGCKAMQVIVKEDGQASQTIVLPRLKSLTLAGLPDVKGFFLGMNEFAWKSLEKVKIDRCPRMLIFTSGQSTAPKLKYMHTSLGKHSLECDLNFHLTRAMHEADRFPWSFSNLVEVDAHYFLDSLVMFPCIELLNLKNLEKLYTTFTKIEEVFEVVEGTDDDDDVNETESIVVVFEKLKEVTLEGLHRLKHMWKSSRWIVLNFPNLTKLSINKCGLLGHVFTGCMVGSLLQLRELKISDCQNMDVIVEDSAETSATEVFFPCLQSLTPEKLPNLKGFCFGKAAFQWPSLDTLEIKDCPQITVFTNGQSTTPKLKLIDTTFGLCHASQDPNSFIKTKQQQGWQF